MDLIAKLEDVEDFPTISTSFARILKVAEDVHATFKDLVEIVETDPALTAKVLKVANSPFYGVSREINDIERAVVLLGIKEIRYIALGLTAFDTMFRKVRGTYFNRGKFWAHSYSAGTMCRFFSTKLDRSENINAFVAGLLHDMGKIILDTYFSKLFEAMMKIMKIEKCSFHDAEVRLIGYGHNKIGAYVAKRWNLSDDIVDAIEGHHDPLHCVHPLTDITFLGNMATHKLGVHTMDFEKRKPEDETEEAEEEEGILLDTIERRWNSEPGRLRSLFAEAAAGSDFGRDDEEEEEEKKKEN